MRVLAFGGLLAVTATSLRAVFLPTGVPGLDLDMVGVSGTPMNIAWIPAFQQYYGGGGGSPSLSGRVWAASGTTVQTLTPINSDLRSFYFNPNTGNLEETTYSANAPFSAAYGMLTVGLNPSGMLTGTYTNTGITPSGLPSDQVVPAFDAIRNLLYAFNGSNAVAAVSRATGLATSMITLDLASAGSPGLMAYSIAYDPYSDALISFTTSGGNRAVAFSATTGAFLASIPLSGLTSPDTSYGLGFANNQLFIYDGSLQAYRGYFITDAVPEPGTAALMALGLLALALKRRRIPASRS